VEEGNGGAGWYVLDHPDAEGEGGGVHYVCDDLEDAVDEPGGAVCAEADYDGADGEEEDEGEGGEDAVGENDGALVGEAWGGVVVVREVVGEIIGIWVVVVAAGSIAASWTVLGGYRDGCCCDGE